MLDSSMLLSNWKEVVRTHSRGPNSFLVWPAIALQYSGGADFP